MYYQSIFEMIEPSLPTGWKKVIVFVWVSAGCREIKFYVKCSDGKYIDCFQLDMNKKDVVMLLLNLQNCIFESENAKWNIMTIAFDENEMCKVDYDYEKTDLNHAVIIEHWKKQYLV